MPTKQHGFSLIELIIAVAIVGILAAIAYPSYQEQVRKGKRTDATGALLDVAQRLERCYTQFNRYDDTTNCTAAAALEGDGVLSTEEEYRIFTKDAEGGSLSATAYTLVAKPIGSQQNDTNCKKFTYTHTGVKNVTDSTKDKDYCW